VVIETCVKHLGGRSLILATGILYLELSRIPNGYVKPLLDPDGGFSFSSETAVRRLRNQNGHYVTVSEFKLAVP
jgi:hypothetical protein